MWSKSAKLRVFLFLLILGVVAVAPVFAGSAVIGSVAGSMNATVGGQTLLPNTTLFSGDSLQVKDGAAVVAIGKASRMVFGRNTIASFLRDTNELTVLLGQGNISMYYPDDAVALRVKAGDVSVIPAPGFKTLGEVAMLNGGVVVTAKEGMLRVEEGGSVVDVVKGKTITVSPKTQRGQGAAAGAGAAHVSSATALTAASVAVGATSTVLSGVAMSRAGDAKTQAAAATTAANSAVSSANSAASAANAAGCALNKLNPALSPYKPPSGLPAC